MKTIKRLELRVYRERLAESKTPYNARIQQPQDVAKIARSIFSGMDREVFLSLPLDAKNRVLGYVEVARGSVDVCPVDPREVFRTAVFMGSSAMIVAHNHPSGETHPSQDDITMTNRIVEAGELLGIPILDHVIVSEAGYFSFVEGGLLTGRER